MTDLMNASVLNDIKDGIRALDEAQIQLFEVQTTVNQMEWFVNQAGQTSAPARLKEIEKFFNLHRKAINAIANRQKGVNLNSESPDDLTIFLNEDSYSVITISGQPIDTKGMAITMPDFTSSTNIASSQIEIDSAQSYVQSIQYKYKFYRKFLVIIEDFTEEKRTAGFIKNIRNFTVANNPNSLKLIDTAYDTQLALNAAETMEKIMKMIEGEVRFASNETDMDNINFAVERINELRSQLYDFQSIISQQTGTRPDFEFKYASADEFTYEDCDYDNEVKRVIKNVAQAKQILEDKVKENNKKLSDLNISLNDDKSIGFSTVQPGYGLEQIEANNESKLFNLEATSFNFKDNQFAKSNTDRKDVSLISKGAFFSFHG